PRSTFSAARPPPHPPGPPPAPPPRTPAPPSTPSSTPATCTSCAASSPAAPPARSPAPPSPSRRSARSPHREELIQLRVRHPRLRVHRHLLVEERLQKVSRKRRVLAEHLHQPVVFQARHERDATGRDLAASRCAVSPGGWLHQQRGSATSRR